MSNPITWEWLSFVLQSQVSLFQKIKIKIKSSQFQIGKFWDSSTEREREFQ